MTLKRPSYQANTLILRKENGRWTAYWLAGRRPADGENRKKGKECIPGEYLLDRNEDDVYDLELGLEYDEGRQEFKLRSQDDRVLRQLELAEEDTEEDEEEEDADDGLELRQNFDVLPELGKLYLDE